MSTRLPQMPFTGDDLIELGIRPGPGFGPLLRRVNAALAATSDLDEDASDAVVLDVLRAYKQEQDAEAAARAARVRPLLAEPARIAVHLDPDNAEEQANLDSVMAAMTGVARTPTVEHVAVMPDACPAGAISVGGVAAARDAIHPGWHSADICCSMFATDLGDVDPKAVLDAAFALSHFGPGGRKRHEEIPLSQDLRDMLDSGNPFFADPKIQGRARSNHGTSGDGNHFVAVGRSEATGSVWLVSHYGSRGFGAGVYDAGMAVAERFRQEICPDLDKGHAWIPASSAEGKAYWEALQIVRAWTKSNHAVLHEAIAAAVGASIRHQRWNPHNMVFVDPADPTLYWHAKGATPVRNAFLPDTDGTQIVPLNMAQPILFVQGGDAPGAHGFAPHGAGRDLSRTQHKRKIGDEKPEAVFARETAGLDARFWSGVIDVSELPSAYKDADKVQAAMARHRLATVVDRIRPYGSIMAGEQNEPWRQKLAAKKAKA